MDGSGGQGICASLLGHLVYAVTIHSLGCPGKHPARLNMKSMTQPSTHEQAGSGGRASADPRLARTNSSGLSGTSPPSVR